MSVDDRSGHIHPQAAPPGMTLPCQRDADFDIASGLRGYLIGLLLSALLSALSFTLVRSTLVWPPSIPIALSVLALAQMGVQVVFFLQITSGEDRNSKILALGFGVLIVMLLVFGSLWIMLNLDQNMLPMEQVMTLQR
jgi:cytochrome o ubiquinol oxidase operon protein cyoD